MSTHRYWVKLTLEVQDYDERGFKLGSTSLKFEPATALTPEPVEFIRNTLAERLEMLANVVVEATQDGLGGSDNE